MGEETLEVIRIVSILMNEETDYDIVRLEVMTPEGTQFIIVDQETYEFMDHSLNTDPVNFDLFEDEFNYA